MKESKNICDLSDISPILGLGDGYIISKDGSITVGFKVTLPELHSLTESDFAPTQADKEGINLLPTLQNAIKELDDGYIFHQQDIFFYNKTSLPDHQGYLARSVKALYNEYNFLDVTTFIFITKKTSTFLSTNYNESAINQFTDVVNRFRASISVFAPTRMNTEDWTKYYESFFSCSFSSNANCVQPLCNISPKEMTFGDKSIKGYYIAGDRNIRDISLCQRNAKFSSSYAHRFNSWVYPMCWEVPCYKIVNNVIYRATKSMILGAVSDYESKVSFLAGMGGAATAAKEYKAYMNSESNVAVLHHFNSFFIYDQQEKLKIEEKLTNAFVKMGIKPTVMSFDFEQTLMSTIGGGSSSLEFPYNLYPSFLDEAVCFSNMENSYAQAQQGIVLADREGTPCVVDLFDEPHRKGIIENWNWIVVGPSGTGKSVAQNKITSSLLMSDFFFFIFDNGGSYRNLCTTLGKHGRYISLDSTGSELSFNPFLLPMIDPSTITGNDKDNFEAERDIICDLLFLCWDTDKSLNIENRNTYSYLAELLTMFYQYRYDNKIEHINFTGFYDFLMRLEKSDKIDRQYFDIKSFKLVMKRFKKGESWGFLMNGEVNMFDFSDIKMIVVELEALAEQEVLYKIVSAQLMILAKRIIYNSTAHHKQLVLDEAWKLLMEEYFGKFLQFQYKTIRKKGGGVCVIVQEVGDLKRSPHYSTMVTNSGTLVMLSHETKENELQKYQNDLSFTNSELAMALSVKKTEHAVFVKQGNISRVYKIQLTPEELILFSSSKKDKVELAQYLKQSDNNIELAITNYCNDKLENN